MTKLFTSLLDQPITEEHDSDQGVYKRLEEVYMVGSAGHRSCVICNTSLARISDKSRFVCNNATCKQEYSTRTLIGTKEGIQHLKCPHCNRLVREITFAHVIMHGFTTTEEFKKKYDLKYLKCQEIRDRVKGSNNPGYQHGGKFSPFSEKFVGGYDAEWHAQHSKNMSEQFNNQPETCPRKVEYWLLQTNGDMTRAKQMLGDYQKKDLNAFIKAYGEEEGKIRHQARTDKWMTTMDSKSDEEKARMESARFSAGVVSKPEIAISDSLKSNGYLMESQFKIYYTDSNYANRRYFMYDFKYQNKIVEFHGDYWHCNPNRFSAEVINKTTKFTAQQVWDKDAKKKQLALDNGYEFMQVWESEYRKDTVETVRLIIEFLES